MKPAILVPLVALGLVLPTGAPLIAGEISPPVLEGGVRASTSEISQAAFGDGPPTGPRHARRSRTAAVPKEVEPSHADMNGATREGADKEYRSKYGF